MRIIFYALARYVYSSGFLCAVVHMELIYENLKLPLINTDLLYNQYSIYKLSQLQARELSANLYFINLYVAYNENISHKISWCKMELGWRNPFFLGIKIRIFLNINIFNFKTFNEFEKLVNYKIWNSNLLKRVFYVLIYCLRVNWFFVSIYFKIFLIDLVFGE